MIPERIRYAREIAGLSRRALAMILECSEGAVYRWEQPAGHPDHRKPTGRRKIMLMRFVETAKEEDMASRGP